MARKRRQPKLLRLTKPLKKPQVAPEEKEESIKTIKLLQLRQPWLSQHQIRLNPNRPRAAKMGKTEVFGKAAPTSFDVEEWMIGNAEMQILHPEPHCWFWEIWCPHCKREVPELQATFENTAAKVKMVGLTK